MERNETMPPLAPPASGQAPAPPAALANQVRKELVRAALFRKSALTRIGRFTLLECIGAGAMGEVYAAYDEQLDRKVALKLVRSNVNASARADERLLREARTLAQVSHPNVVQVYEAGVHEHGVFLAMEFIRGKTLTAWLESAAELPRRQRQNEILHRFIAAGRGLEAAHAAGLAHRDFKPDNVLVGEDGRVRVVDFGLARAVVGVRAASASDAGREAVEVSGVAATELPRGDVFVQTDASTLDAALPGASSATEEPAPIELVEAPARAESGRPDPEAGHPAGRKAAERLTTTGFVMGTPRYMAPEQMRGLAADHQSDQFSFCVALFHALYGTWPFEGKSFVELMRTVESGEIRSPSQPAHVSALVRKALLRGLSRDPADRFPSMTELLRVLEDSLQGRWRTGRVRGAAAAVIIVGVGLAALALTPGDPCADVTADIDALWTPARKRALEDAFTATALPYARTTWQTTAGLIDRYVDAWRDEARDTCEDREAGRYVSPAIHDRRMMCLDVRRQHLDALLATVESSPADSVERAVDAAASLPGLAACNDVASLEKGMAPVPPALAKTVEAVRQRLAEARIQQFFGHLDEAIDIAEQQRRAVESLPYEPVRAEALHLVGSILVARDTTEDAARAEALLLQAVDLAASVHHDELVVDIWHQLTFLARVHHATTREGHRWSGHEQAAVRRAGDRPEARARALQALGQLFYKDGDYPRAAEQYRAAIALLVAVPGQDLLLATCREALASTERRLGNFDAARVLFEHALKVSSERLGAEHPVTVKWQRNFAQMLIEAEDLDPARELLERALGTWTRLQGTSNLLAGNMHADLADIELAAGAFEKARMHVRSMAAIYEQARAPGHIDHASPLFLSGRIERQQGNLAAARAAFEGAVDIRRRHVGDRDPWVGVIRTFLAETLVEAGSHEEALALCERIDAVVAGDVALRTMLLVVRGRALLGLGRAAHAVDVLEQAMVQLDGLSGYARERADTMWALARALQASGVRAGERIRALAEGARTIYASAGPAGASNRDAITGWLDALDAGHHFQ
jgi:serine/threonine protein kinase/tetratricopeptide (TPR) repeat protein